MVFSSSHVWMWDLDHKEGWVQKNRWFQTVVMEKILESPLDCKEIKPVKPKGNQSWIFIGRTDAEAEAPILWPPDEKNWLIGKDPDTQKDWRQEEKGTTEDEMFVYHLWLNGKEASKNSHVEFRACSMFLHLDQKLKVICSLLKQSPPGLPLSLLLLITAQTRYDYFYILYKWFNLYFVRIPFILNILLILLHNTVSLSLHPKPASYKRSKMPASRTEHSIALSDVKVTCTPQCTSDASWCLPHG